MARQMRMEESMHSSLRSFHSDDSAFLHTTTTGTATILDGTGRASPLQIHVTARPGPQCNAASTGNLLQREDSPQCTPTVPLCTAGADTAAEVSVNCDEKDVAPPLTAEEESWGQWSWRHLYNGGLLFMTSMYQVAQINLRHEKIDTNVVDYANTIYMPAPPTAAEVRRQSEEATTAVRYGEGSELSQRDGALENAAP